MTKRKNTEDFCVALDAELNCHRHHGSRSSKKGKCEACPLALFWLVYERRMLTAESNPNTYDLVRWAVGRSIPHKAGQEIVRDAIRTSMEGDTEDENDIDLS